MRNNTVLRIGVIILLSLLVTACSSEPREYDFAVSVAEGPDFAKKTIDLKLQKYEEKLVACERVESNRYSPGDDALDVLIQRAEPFSSGCALSN